MYTFDFMNPQTKKSGNSSMKDFTIDGQVAVHAVYGRPHSPKLKSAFNKQYVKRISTKCNQCISIWLSCKSKHRFHLLYFTLFMGRAKDICKHVWCYLSCFLSYLSFSVINCVNLYSIHLRLHESTGKKDLGISSGKNSQ